MPFFKSAFSRLSRKTTSTPVVAINNSVDSWYHSVRAQPTRFIKSIDICTALAAGEDAWGTPVDETHLHTFLRVSLAPTASGSPNPEEGDVLLIERVLSTGGAYHSVTPISEPPSAGGTLFHPDVYDHVCVVSDGLSTVLARHLEVERTLEFGNHSSDSHLTLLQFAQVLELISHTTKLICAGGDCKFQSRSFAFTCMAALTPRLPPALLIRKAGEGVGTNDKNEADWMTDAMFEVGAEAFLSKMPWLVDFGSVQTLKLISALKDEHRGRER